MRYWLSSLVLAVATAVAAPSRAWTVGSGVTTPCHEKLTGSAYNDSVLDTAGNNIVLPSDDMWLRLSDYLLEKLPIRDKQLSDRQRFMLVSLMIGVRAPDTDGHALTNVENLHNLHGDRSAEGQYKHGLRAPGDDYDEGNVKAVDGTRREILAMLALGESYMAKSPPERIVEAPFYLDYYGEVRVNVYAPLFYIGQALHTFQDTFSHTLRDKHDDYHSIVHVMNYIDAIGSDFDERRDGLAHSNAMDDCKRKDLAGITSKTVEASREFLDAVHDQYALNDETRVPAVMEKWLTLKQGCTWDNDFCDNRELLDIARSDPTGPYLEEFVGCSVVPGHGSGRAGAALMLVMLLGGVAWFGYRQR